MASNTALKLHQSRPGVSVPGCWKLAPERAFTLKPDQAGTLRITQGRLWATLDGPHHGPANDWGDVVLHAGAQLTLAPGRQVVVEPFGNAVNEPVYFSWEPSVAPENQAPGRLLSRFAAALKYFVAGKGRVLSRFESNQP